MPGAQIAIDQDRPGPTVSAGTPGYARNDLWLNRVVRPRSVNTHGSYLWTLLDKPPGSTAVITSSSAQTCAFTPDIAGSYRIQLIVSGGGLGNTQILVAACTLDTNGVEVNNGWRLPALGEEPEEVNFAGQTRGWAEAIEKIIGDIASFFTFDTVSSKLYVNVAETINQGTAQGLVNTLEAQLKTTDSANHPLSLLALPSNSLALYEVEVLCIKADSSIGGYFKKSKAFLRKGATVTGGSTRNVDKQFISDPVVANPTWDITLDDDGSGNARTNVNGQGDTVTWYVVRQGLRILPAP